MPPSVSVKSQNLLHERARIDEGRLSTAEHPVWIETRFVKGYFEAAKLRDLCSEREDLSYLTKTVRNVDRDAVPGFSFVREGGETLNDFFKAVLATDRRAAPDAAPRETASPPTE